MIDRMLLMDDAHVAAAGRLVRVRADVKYPADGEHRSVFRRRFMSVCMCGRPITSGGCYQCRWRWREPLVIDETELAFDPQEFAVEDRRPPAPKRKRQPKPRAAPAIRPPTRAIASSTRLSESEVAAIRRAESYRR